MPEHRDLSLYVSFFEIYGGKAHDLLHKNTQLAIREDGPCRGAEAEGGGGSRQAGRGRAAGVDAVVAAVGWHVGLYGRGFLCGERERESGQGYAPSGDAGQLARARRKGRQDRGAESETAGQRE